MESIVDLRNEINTILDYFKRSKAFFQYIGDEYVNERKLTPYNIAPGVQQFTEYDKPITKEFQERQNSIGHYLNQNFCIRLLAVLNSHHVVGDKKEESIDQNLPGWEDLEILRRLRHRFAHSSGKYDSRDSDDKKLMQALMLKYEPCPKEPPDFPINQDKVIYPITKAVLQYAEAKFSRQ